MPTATEPRMMNGINVDQAYGTIDAIKAQPELARFQFRATNSWIGGTHNRSTIKGLYAACQEDETRKQAFVVDAGEPEILLGHDEGPNPAEYLLHAIAACVTTSIVCVAAARGVKLTEVRSTVEGNADVRGALGISPDVRNGFQSIKMSFVVRGDAPEEKLRQVVERAQSRSFVYDSITKGVPITIDVMAA